MLVRAPRRPALAPALCFLAAVALGLRLRLPVSPSWVGAAAAVALAAVFLLRRRPRARLLALLIAAALAGAWAGLDAAGRATARTAGWVPVDGLGVETHLVGVVLAAAEAEPRGERVVRIRGGPELPRAQFSPAVVQLRIVPSPKAPTAEVDCLRRGDVVRVWARVRQPRRLRDPGQPDPEIALRARGIDALASVKSARLLTRLRVGSPGLGRALDALKVRARRRLDRALGTAGATRAVVGAMLLGDRGGLSASEMRSLRDAGFVHVLSISGLHVGLVVLVLLAALRRARFGPPGVLVVAGLVLALTTAFVGAQPPVLRAAAAAAILLLGRAIGREGDALNTLAVVACALTAYHPHALQGVSFQLSFLATAGLLALTRPIALRLPVPRPFATALGLSCAAYATTAPVLARQFGRLAPAGVLANLVAAPLCGAVLVAGGLTLALEGIPWAGPRAAAAAEMAVGALLASCRLAAEVPCGAFRVGAPSPALVATYGLLLVAACRARRAVMRRGFALMSCLALYLVHLGPFPGREPTRIEAAVLDVGQGQAVVLRGGSGFVVVDAGGSGGGRFDVGDRVIAPLLASAGCRRIEVLAVTHGHDDHAGGAAALLREFEVGELWLPPHGASEPATRMLADEGLRQGAALVLGARGLVRARGGMRLEVLHPPRTPDSWLGDNDRSMVVRVGLPPFRVLVPGDIEGAGERSLAGSGLDLAAEALVVPHHGGRTSSSEPFLDAVAPRVAIVSAGAGNVFGHPHPTVLDRLAFRGIETHRTDHEGIVLLRGTDRGWEVRTPLRSRAHGNGNEREEEHHE